MPEHTQAMDRRDMVLRDEFKRPWLAALEIKTFEPTGHVTPAGWDDVLRTPQQYLRIPRDEFNNPQVGQLRIDWDRWIKDQADATKDWKVRLWNIGREQQKNAFDPAKAEHDEYLLHLTGPKPWPTPEALRLAKAGDRQLLGIKPLDKRSRTLLGLVELEDLEAAPAEALADEAEHAPLNTGNHKEFIAACLERGITMKKAAQLWREFQTALKEE